MLPLRNSTKDKQERDEMTGIYVRRTVLLNFHVCFVIWGVKPWRLVWRRQHTDEVVQSFGMSRQS